ncbi:pre-mRNA cleavage complex 2 protein Pcf11-like isoform X3 [Ornithodoros turicata]|uniref:pre-mRNA cleavage complex 2 protein Pcf11-like isoform X3 n=1 Tax=Ornithodoros turicata TaxID=34597 RepID=UPI003139FBC0
MEEGVSTEYKESLRDLQFNSKPLINMLTILAEENIGQAPRIVHTIEEHLQKVPVELKIPVLYLIDSIMKNVGGAYCTLFMQNIVANFCSVFEKGEDKTRLQLFKLRQTWTDLLPNQKLYGLDEQVKNMDSAWPILAKPPHIHINPKFLKADVTSSEGVKRLLQKQQDIQLGRQMKQDAEEDVKNKSMADTRAPLSTAKEPPQKRMKGNDSNNPLGNYRRLENSATGWAQYKAARPDEFKSPLRRDQHLQLVPPSVCALPNGGFQGGMQPTMDRFGRPFFRRLMSDPRFRGHMMMGPGERQQLEQMLANPEFFLEQTEQQLRSGRLDPEQHRRIKADLEKLSQFRRAQPCSTRGDWGPLGGERWSNFSNWNPPLLGMQEGFPHVAPPPPRPNFRTGNPFSENAPGLDRRARDGILWDGHVGPWPQRQESAGWVRYGGEERPANWFGAPPQQQAPQDAGTRWQLPPNRWNSFGNGRGLRGCQQNFSKEYPSCFTEDFRQHMGVLWPQLDIPPPPPGMLILPRGPPPTVSPSNALSVCGAPTVLEVNVEQLFAKLVAVGILKANSKKEESLQECAMKEELENIPPLTFQDVTMLKTKHPGVISSLYIGAQCASCGLRFTNDKSKKYSQHLDWHFRTNRRCKDGIRKAFSRKWFYEVEDWIQFEEIEDLEERARSFFEQQASIVQDLNSPDMVESVPAMGDGTSCAVCNEAFQLFWVEEEEEWHFRDAMRAKDKIYHPACYEDFKRLQARSDGDGQDNMDETPSEQESDVIALRAPVTSEEPRVLPPVQRGAELSGLCSIM